MSRKLKNKMISAFLLVFILLCDLAIGQVIQNDVFWKDISGNPIYSQGGNVIKVGDTYYWYGVKYTGAVDYYNTLKMNSASDFSAFTCYSSKDLATWKFENNIFAPKVSGWVGRCGVAYNKNTKKYVLISQYPGGELFATCNTPNGNFTLDHVAIPPGITNTYTGDQTVFNDNDGKSYIICSSSSGRSHLYVMPLRASDFLAFENPVEIYKGNGREGNCMFKYNGRYYFCSSDLHGWNTSLCYYLSATNILGPYSNEEVMANTNLDFCHVTQTGFFITVTGTSSTTVLFCGDRWSDFAGNGIGFNQWCPVTFNGTIPVFNSLSQFVIDAPAGTWHVGNGNNYILNPGFEADRVLQTPLAGWANAQNASGSHSAGRFCLQQNTSGTVSQDINNLSVGAYELKAWVQSSGGQSTCKIFITGFGGEEMNYPINSQIGNWTQISIPGIHITSGTCTAGIISVNKGSNWCKVDDFSLCKVGGDTLYGVNLKAAPGGIIKQSPVGDSLAKSSEITFTAVPLDGWEFAGWSGDHTGINPHFTISSLNSDITLNAGFTFASLDSSSL